jgi:signal transduction histidine kinase
VKSVLRNIVFVCFFCFSFLHANGQDGKDVQVKVLDQHGLPLKGAAVSVQNSDYFSSNEEGTFMLKSPGLRVPVRAEFRDPKFEVLETAYFEEESRLLIKAQRLYEPNEVLEIVFLNEEEERVLSKIGFHYQGVAYTTNEKGELSLASSIYYTDKKWSINGYEVTAQQLDEKTHRLQVVLKSLPQAIPLVSDTVMLTYEADFERITREIEKERSIFEEKNKEIEGEILKIRDNLVHEDKVSDSQRRELKRYLGNMEKVVRENSEAIRQSEERTKEALARLRMIIMEKDSLNMVAQGRIVQMEAEQVETEENYRRKIAVFSAVIIALLLTALLIYFFADKFRRQKAWLKEVNKRLKAVQIDLTTSLKELNLRKTQIEDHNNQLELFVYKASHDIKGPLRSIMGLTQIGMVDVKDDTAQEYFGHIHKSTKRLDNLLADLLRLTKAKQAEVEKQEIDLPVMVEDIIQSFKNIRHFDRVKIQVDIQEGIHFESDEKMLYSVIQNFVENGIKYCDPAKEESILDISVQQETGKTTFLFKDNGLGVDADHLPKIFDMFYKIDPNSEGTGLGLHIVKVTIEKLGGTIKVNSRKGGGSLFTITFYA